MKRLLYTTYFVSNVHTLSLLVQLRPARQTDFEVTIKEFSAKLSLVPLPPPGQLHVVKKHLFLILSSFLCQSVSFSL